MLTLQIPMFQGMSDSEWQLYSVVVCALIYLRYLDPLHTELGELYVILSINSIHSGENIHTLFISSLIH